MVLCNYFIIGHCRFGSKCMNDHIDLKALLKTEVESAINGKQWLLSCFGPFKESANVPNLVDRSFEEVRLDFMEAAKTGNQQQHIMELISQYNDAMGKLNQLKVASPDTIQLIANIYNQSVQEQKTPQTSNPFGVSNTSQAPAPQTQNPFQLGNVFGGTQPQTAALNAGSIFGGAPANSNPFQVASQASIFGAQKEQQSQATSNFSFSLNQQTPQQSVFEMSSQPTQPQTSIFGGTQVIQPHQQTQKGSIFSGQQSTFGPNSVFGSSSLQQPQQSNSIFGSSVFGQSQPAPQNIFAQTQQVAPQNSTFSQPPTNVFGSFQTQPEPLVQNSGNIFAQPQQNIFSMQQTAPSQQPQLPTAPGAIFQIQQPPANSQQAFGANPFQTQPAPVDESAYSRPEDLTSEEMQAFQDDTFKLGSIPRNPPPKHLCI